MRSLLAQAANGLFQTDLSTFAQQQQQASSSSNRSETDALSSDFDSIALAGQLDNDRPSALAGLGDPNGLSNRVPSGVAAACTQILSAALPSFIPSMVAPLVCVFSYQTPSISDLAPIPYTPYPQPDASSSSSSNIRVEEPARKEFVYPWGHPNEPPPPTFQPTPPTQTQTQSPSSSLLSSPSTTTTSPNGKSRKHHHQRQQQPPPSEVPDSGIVVVHSKTWTQHEREALYLAATRFRLSGQWSKIREMMNLHRTDKEIESEYKKLYAHRENDLDNDFDDDEDEDYHYPAVTSVIDALNHQDRFSNSNSNSDNDADVDDIDADDDEGTEKIFFMKFGGGLRSAQQRRQQLQHQQSRRLHYDQLHFQQQPVPQQELQHHQYHQQQQQQPHQYQERNNAFNVPPLHDSHYQQHQHNHLQPQQQQQRLSTDPDPIRIFKKEFMIDKRFTLEEIPVRL
ncbi:hypothetical protein BGW39_011551 [Mortierella sp. 14UC]|nr:hypothetical protein BGW39_011551 [Mortierella sp. 14UC]